MREKSGGVDVAEIANKARIHEEYTRALTEDYHRRLSLNAAARARAHVTAACAPGGEVAGRAGVTRTPTRPAVFLSREQNRELKQPQKGGMIF